MALTQSVNTLLSRMRADLWANGLFLSEMKSSLRK